MPMGKMVGFLVLSWMEAFQTVPDHLKLGSNACGHLQGFLNHMLIFKDGAELSQPHVESVICQLCYPVSQMAI